MKVIAIANLKGGVGKSSTTLFVAERWALEGMRVLVIDLDPQSNSSFMFLSREGLDQWERGHKTLQHFFQAVRDKDAQASWKSHHFVVPRSSDVDELHKGGGYGYVSILPSTPEMWFVEYDFDKACFKADLDPVAERAESLRLLLEQERGNYDCVLIDCPPGFGSLTRAGLKLADHIVTPTIADYVSVRSMTDFFRLGLIGAGKNLRDDVSIVISKFDGNNFQKSVLDLLKRDYHVILPPIRLKNQVFRITESYPGVRRSYETKYANGVGDEVKGMARALRIRILGY